LLGLNCVVPSDGIVLCRIININPYDVRLHKGRRIAQISAVETHDITTIDAVTMQDEQPIQTDDNDETAVEHEPDGDVTNYDKLKVLQDMGMRIDPDDVTEDERRQLIDLLYKYREVFSDKIVGIRDFEYEIQLKDGKLPPRAKQIYYNPPMQRIVDEELRKLEEKGIIKRDTFVYASPLILVKKKCGCSIRLKGDRLKRGASSAQLPDCQCPKNNWRVVSDNRLLNSCIVQTPFSPPNVEALSDHFRLEGRSPSKYFLHFRCISRLLATTTVTIVY